MFYYSLFYLICKKKMLCITINKGYVNFSQVKSYLYDANCSSPCTALHFRVPFHFGCCLCRAGHWANVKVSLSGSSIACYRLVRFSSSCLQPLTEDHPDISPNPPTHFLCPQRAAVHREAWPHSTHTQPHKHNIPPHTQHKHTHANIQSFGSHSGADTNFLTLTWETISQTHSQTVNGYELFENAIWFGSYLKVSPSTGVCGH